ncbi:hypothetical protein F7725_009427 [Dissostichus mawsoni]|uniref:Uncharacterized protein n=1 Tax=Dissostichus mawsoni TaxID=36200 RepID=A0A7J5XM73_DISMA|nr:hypothetical protein F7725_009427 [Dissostichus mawsoni]
MIDWMLCSATDPHSPAQHRPSIRACWCGRPLKRRNQWPVNCTTTTTKESGLGADNLIDTIVAMEDQRAEASKENEDRRAMVSKEIREEQLVHSRKAQEAEEQLLMVMARQADVSARQVEQQNTFQIGLLGVLSELVKSKRPSSL